MTPDQLRALRYRLGFTQVDLAQALRVSPNTVARWEQGKHRVGAVVQLALMHLERTYGDRGAMIRGEYTPKRGDKGRPFSPASHVWAHPEWGTTEPKWETRLKQQSMKRRIRMEQARERKAR